ncbi:MAG: hypothetical protein RLY22_487, partial [Actinomycetota bacterium]
MKRILYVAFDQLNLNHGVLKTANPGEDAIVLVESARMTTGRPWHKERLFFLLSSARHFALELETRGFKVHYVQSATTLDGIAEAKKTLGELPVFCAEPSSHVQMLLLSEAGIQFVPNDFFLTSRALFFQWAEKQKSYVMENFYRAQRVRLNILMQGADPVGGRWNYDADNRLPPPKNYTWP